LLRKLWTGNPDAARPASQPGNWLRSAKFPRSLKSPGPHPPSTPRGRRILLSGYEPV
jgi:hypothetical protein